MQPQQIKRGTEYQVQVLWPDYPAERITILSRAPSVGEGWFRARFHNDGCVSVVHASRIEEAA